MNVTNNRRRSIFTAISYCCWHPAHCLPSGWQGQPRHVIFALAGTALPLRLQRGQVFPATQAESICSILLCDDPPSCQQRKESKREVGRKTLLKAYMRYITKSTFHFSTGSGRIIGCEVGGSQHDASVTTCRSCPLPFQTVVFSLAPYIVVYSITTHCDSDLTCRMTSTL